MIEQLTDDLSDVRQPPQVAPPPERRGTWVYVGDVDDSGRLIQTIQPETTQTASTDLIEVTPDPTVIPERTKRRGRLIPILAVTAVLAVGIGVPTVSILASSTSSTKTVADPTVAPTEAPTDSVVSSTSADKLPKNGIVMEKPQAYGEDSLNPNVAWLPSAVYGVITINSGYMDLVPEFTTDASPKTPIGIKLNWSTLTTKKGLETTDGYNDATLNNLPLGITIRDVEGAVTYDKKTKTYTVDRSKLSVLLEGPNSTSMIQQQITAAPQVTSATETKTDVTKGQYATLPDVKTNSMFIPTIASDKLYTTSRTNFLTAMQSPKQIQAIVALEEQKAVADINSSNVVGKSQNIIYTNGQKFNTIGQAIDQLLSQRLGTDKVVYKLSYDLEFDVPHDPKTTLPITDPKAGWITGLDTDVNFNLGSASVAFGAVKVPPKPTPTPTATPTPTPTKTAKTAP